MGNIISFVGGVVCLFAVFDMFDIGTNQEDANPAKKPLTKLLCGVLAVVVGIGLNHLGV